MKVAVQFFGHLRTFDKCANSVVRHLLSHYDCDVFMHTWSKTDHTTKTWYQNERQIRSITEKEIETLKKIYHLKSIIVEEQKITEDTDFLACQHNRGKTAVSSQGMKFMLYSQKKVNELRQKYQKKHQTQYDYVVMIRPDIRLKKDFILEDVDREITVRQDLPARYCACGISRSKDFPIIGDCASDIIFLGRPKAIDKVVNILNDIDFRKHQQDMWCPEELFYFELEKAGISNFFLNYIQGRDWEIVRPLDVVKISTHLIRVKIRKNFLRLRFISFFPYTVLSIRTVLFGFFRIEFCIGRPEKD